MSKKQVYNSRSKFWVLLEDGTPGFIDRSKTKFPGVPVVNESQQNNEDKTQMEALQEEDKKAPEEGKDQSNSSTFLERLFGS